MNLAKLQYIKLTLQKYVAFLYTNNEAAEKEIKELILFATVPKTIKYLDT